MSTLFLGLFLPSGHIHLSGNTNNDTKDDNSICIVSKCELQESCSERLTAEDARNSVETWLRLISPHPSSPFKEAEERSVSCLLCTDKKKVPLLNFSRPEMFVFVGVTLLLQPSQVP